MDLNVSMLAIATSIMHDESAKTFSEVNELQSESESYYNLNFHWICFSLNSPALYGRMGTKLQLLLHHLQAGGQFVCIWVRVGTPWASC